MKQLTCEMCGSTDLMKQDGVFVCQTCGMKYSVEEAKKMMIEGTVDVQGTVKVNAFYANGTMGVGEGEVFVEGSDFTVDYEDGTLTLPVLPEGSEIAQFVVKYDRKVSDGGY